MPTKAALEQAKKAKRAGKSPSTQAGAFVHEEMEKIRQGKHGARSPQQAIAIGLSEARRAGVELPPPAKGKVSAKSRKSAQYAYDVGQHKRTPEHRPRVARAVTKTLQNEPRDTASTEALSKHAVEAAQRRSAASRSKAAKKAAQTKGPAGRSKAAQKAAKTRSRSAG